MTNSTANASPRYRIRGYKPRNYNSKKIISESKFHRIFNANLHSAGVASIYRNHQFVNSLQACVIGDYCYAMLPCKVQAGNRIDCYYVRYNLVDNPQDWISFRPYPSPIFAPVEF